jgi:cytidylate kinase
MAIVTVSGETGCRSEELARAAAQRLQFELVTEARLAGLVLEEFGDAGVPDRAWAPAVTSVLARVAVDHHLVVGVPGAESLFPNLPGCLRVRVSARAAHRTGAIMIERRLDRAGAAVALREIESTERGLGKRRFGKSAPAVHDFDLIFNAESFEVEQMAALIAAAADTRGLLDFGLLPAAAESQIQFQARLQLARFNIVPAGKATIKHRPFGHPSEEMFANLLDFYRIAWEYEPRSFPLQWDKEGKMVEAFTPDFYLPEYDLYVELTTMKQALVTRKNRKIKLLRAIYPHVNIQVLYQRDFQDLVSKHGLSERVPAL